MSDETPLAGKSRHVKKALSLTVFLYSHPLIRYIFVGGSTFVMYFLIIAFLHDKQDLRLSVATTIAYWTSILWNFSLNRWWTFSAAETKSLYKHAAAYLLLLAFNYTFNLIFVLLFSQIVSYKIAVPVAVLIQTSWTYYVYKNYIFKK